MDVQTVPQDREAEAAVCGALLTNPLLVDEVELSPEAFFHEETRAVFTVSKQLRAEGITPDVVTVANRLREAGEWNLMGGSVALKRMADAAAHSCSFQAYAAIVQNCATNRAIVEAGQTMVAMASQNSDSDENRAEAEKLVLSLAEQGELRVCRASEAISEGRERRRRRREGESIASIPTGIISLDEKCGGMAPGQFIVLAARTGCGKTALALNIADHVAVTLAKATCYVSLEMDRGEVSDRLLSSRAEVCLQRITNGDTSDSEEDLVVEAENRILAAPLYIDDRPTQTVSQIASTCRRMKRKEGLELLIVDYIQLLESEISKRETRVAQVSDMTRRLKNLARELQLPILALAQLNREADAERPKLKHLRESGSIEQDADQVWFVHHELNNQSRPNGQATVIVAKRRNGPQGDAAVTWRGRYVQFRDAAPKYRDSDEFSDAPGVDFQGPPEDDLFPE